MNGDGQGGFQAPGVLAYLLYRVGEHGHWRMAELGFCRTREEIKSRASEWELGQRFDEPVSERKLAINPFMHVEDFEG